MESPPTQQWFYSREGVQHGPVSLDELSRIAQSGGLNPRQDLVWTQEMDDWKPAGEIEGLFERRVPATAAAGTPVSSTSNPYTPPGHESGTQLMERAGDWPGVRRRGYIFGAIILPMLIGVGLVIADEQGIVMDANLRLALEWIVPSLIGLYFTIQRFPNLGMSRWWTLGYLLPILNLWVGYRQFACPAGYAYHKKLDGPGIALAIIYWLFITLILVAIGLLIAVMTGNLGDAEFQEMLREAISEAYPVAPAP